MTAKRTAELVTGSAFAATVLLSVPLVLGFLGGWHPALDSLGHFRAHLAVLCALGGLVALASRYWRQGLLAMALGAAALWTTLGAYPIGGPTNAARADPGDRAVYRLLQLNLFANDRGLESVVSLIGRVKPDVVTLQEMSLGWQPWIDRISAMYPYSIFCPRRSVGVALLSRRPFAPGTSPKCLHSGSLAIAEIDFGGRVLDFASLHLSWPWPFKQSAQIEAMQPTLAGLGETTMLAGDMNAAPWSSALRHIEAASGARHVTGIGPTWLHRRMPDALRPYLGLPIDHILSKGDIDIVSIRTLETVGSDHLPVLVEFSLNDSAPKDGDETTTVMLAR